MVGTPHSYASPFCGFFDLVDSKCERKIPPAEKTIPQTINNISEPGPIMSKVIKFLTEKFIDEKEQIIYQLNLYGIQPIRSSPGELSINVINKYLELKSRGMI
jgi:hypothetical protein